MPALKFQRETYAAIWPELLPLLSAHDLELWPDRQWGAVGPDHRWYLSREADGSLVILTARAPDGSLVGYCSEILAPDRHYQGLSSSFNDTIYLRPEWRTRGLMSYAARLLLERERMLDEYKVVRRRISTKTWLDFGGLLERLGYVHEAVVYHRIVEFA